MAPIGQTEVEAEDVIDPTVRAAIDKVYGDTTVSQTVTWSRLDTIIEYCREAQQSLGEADQFDKFGT